MKNITILVPYTAITACIVDPHYMFTAVNQFYIEDGKAAPFHIQLVGLEETIALNNGLVSIQTNALLKDVQRSDLIIIPALSGDLEKAIVMNQEMIPWLVNQYKNGAEVASLCVGSFLFAATGLLNGKSSSTHWLHADKFRQLFPQVALLDEQIITEQNGLYTSGGATSYWNLLLHLVEKYTNKETAVLASKYFLLDVGKNNQNAFMIFRGQRSHEDNEILKVQDFIEEHFEKKFNVEELCHNFNIARRTFERRFKKATNNTIVEYIQRVKIEAAKKQFERGRKTVNEVMYNVGYSDSKAFRDVFRKYTSIAPIDYRNKYQNIGNS